MFHLFNQMVVTNAYSIFHKFLAYVVHQHGTISFITYKLDIIYTTNLLIIIVIQSHYWNSNNNINNSAHFFSDGPYHGLFNELVKSNFKHSYSYYHLIFLYNWHIPLQISHISGRQCNTINCCTLLFLWKQK